MAAAGPPPSSAAAAGPYYDELVRNAKLIGTAGKGILAADESTGTIGQRFSGIQVENNKENRQRFRDLLFSAPDLEKYVVGVILYDETIRQSTSTGVPFAQHLTSRGILPGIKVDKGVKPLYGTNGETTVQGLDDLDARCKEYYELGARFAKWRAVYKIDVPNGCPSQLSIHENAYGLARYAAICQANGLVPIVEPEILMDGSHNMRTAIDVAVQVFSAVVRALHEHHVLLEGALLKPNMILPGSSCPDKATPAEIGMATVTVLRRTLPAAMPSVNFLSGGMSEEEASVNLNALNTVPLERPWCLSFSYGRALQQSCLKAWKGKDENISAAQTALIERCKANAEASLGQYKGGAGGADANASLFVSNYKY